MTQHKVNLMSYSSHFGIVSNAWREASLTASTDSSIITSPVVLVVVFQKSLVVLLFRSALHFFWHWGRKDMWKICTWDQSRSHQRPQAINVNSCKIPGLQHHSDILICKFRDMSDITTLVLNSYSQQNWTQMPLPPPPPLFLISACLHTMLFARFMFEALFEQKNNCAIFVVAWRFANDLQICNDSLFNVHDHPSGFLEK